MAAIGEQVEMEHDNQERRNLAVCKVRHTSTRQQHSTWIANGLLVRYEHPVEMVGRSRRTWCLLTTNQVISKPGEEDDAGRGWAGARGAQNCELEFLVPSLNDSWEAGKKRIRVNLNPDYLFHTFADIDFTVVAIRKSSIAKLKENGIVPIALRGSGTDSPLSAKELAESYPSFDVVQTPNLGEIPFHRDFQDKGPPPPGADGQIRSYGHQGLCTGRVTFAGDVEIRAPRPITIGSPVFFEHTNNLVMITLQAGQPDPTVRGEWTRVTTCHRLSLRCHLPLSAALNTRRTALDRTHRSPSPRGSRSGDA